jgi:hypothetical protein
VTDSSDPRRPKSSRKKPSREPATIDLKATVIDDGVAPAPGPGPETQDTLGNDTPGNDAPGYDTVGQDALAEAPTQETIPAGETADMKPDETIASGSEPPAEDLVASPEASLDSGIGTDTLPIGASVEEPGEGIGRQDTISSDSSFQEPSASRTREDIVPPPAQERRGSAGALIGSGLLGGLVGAGLLYGLQAWQGSPAQDDPRFAQLEQRVNALGRQPAPGARNGPWRA